MPKSPNPQTFAAWAINERFNAHGDYLYIMPSNSIENCLVQLRAAPQLTLVAWMKDINDTVTSLYECRETRSLIRSEIYGTSGPLGYLGNGTVMVCSTTYQGLEHWVVSLQVNDQVFDELLKPQIGQGG